MNRANQYDREIIVRIITMISQDLDGNVTHARYKTWLYNAEQLMRNVSKRVIEDLADIVAEEMTRKGLCVKKSRHEHTMQQSNKKWLVEKMMEYGQSKEKQNEQI